MTEGLTVRAVHSSADMRIPSMSALVLAATVAACVGRALPSSRDSGRPSSGATSTAPASVDRDVIRYTNAARARNGVPPLAENAKLMAAASIQSQQMAQFQRADHTIDGAQYPTLQARLQAVAYVYSNAAENVAWNQRDAPSVVSSWMSSTGHRANILDPALREIGVAMTQSANGERYWVQVFGSPR
ncbi:MAG TPA: CAP domain-containing protein [Gemmatimonadaceae bacterium]|nr:CAP domain-containing protein [Gemmatimonadaceae bacterium]